MSDNATFTTGACAYCGQQLTVVPADSQNDADERATDSCNCPGAKEARADEEHRQARIEKREETLDSAKADLDDLFGEGAAEKGKRSVKPEVLAWLYQGAVFVYDELLRKVQFTVTQGISGTISKTDKGKLTIQRDDKTTTKKEYKD